jgi:hypothetical protein
MDRRATLLWIPSDFNLAVPFGWETTSCYAAASAQQVNDEHH